MQLVRAGKIELDAPVQTHLPWLRVADADGSEFIIVRQLLNMDSGIPQSIGQEQIANVFLILPFASNTNSSETPPGAAE
jgi:CubicO group peptidase (beta-lactamase class C family)